MPLHGLSAIQHLTQQNFSQRALLETVTNKKNQFSFINCSLLGAFRMPRSINSCSSDLDKFFISELLDSRNAETTLQLQRNHRRDEHYNPHKLRKFIFTRVTKKAHHVIRTF